ncbi:MAG TPA: 30S ribosomal protein S6 [Thermoanaerobaculia bacterium]|nr:30S ribosomal protein S6 [Thermoanaerobaculia bacterium]
MRTYELVFVVDPRVSDEEVVELTGEYKQMLTGGGLVIAREESWGRRKLAFPIHKLTEGKYVVLYLSSEDGTRTLADVEHRMNQNDKVLRYLSVRTDLDLKRAGRPQLPEPIGEGTPAVAGERAAEGGRSGREE